jgi:hypothetical protein
MAKTVLQTVNHVLSLLREDEVSATSDSTYATLMRRFVDLAVQEVENSWDWHNLRATAEATTSVDTYRYILTDVGHYSTILQVTSTDSAGNTYILKPLNFNRMTRYFRDSTLQTGQPVWYSIAGYDTNDDPIFDVYPVPDAAYTLKFDHIARTTDDLTDSDTLTVPHWPVIFNAYARAIEERGESGSISAVSAKADYMKSLSAAILADSSHTVSELQLTPV